MLFKSLVLLLVSLVLCQAQLLRRYYGQTVAEIIMKPESFPLCKCSNGKCEIDHKAADEACHVLMERFRYYVHPNAYMAICEFQPKSCQELVGGRPKEYILHGIYDSYYLRTSPFHFEHYSAARALTQLFHRNEFFKHRAFDIPPVLSRVKEGTTAMPIEFEGVVNIPEAELGKLELCSSAFCRQKLTQLCSDFIKSLDKGVPEMMKQFYGCHVSGIYKWEDKVRAAWSIMVHYQQLRASKVITTRKSLKELVEKIKTHVKPEGLVKEYKIVGVKPLDYCEVEAYGTTHLKYHRFMVDPTSVPYRVNSAYLYKSLAQQLWVGDSNNRSCVRQILQMKLEDANGFIKSTSRLWLSLTCFKKRGVQNCNDMAKKIEEIWQEGSRKAYNFMTPVYTFKGVYQGTPLDL